MKTLILISLLLIGHLGFAGSEGVGGGDLCENQIKIIRDDLKQWIFKGGHQSLVLSQEISHSDYGYRMLQSMENTTKIKCVSSGDKHYPIEVDGTPKVCKFIKNKDSSEILCDFKKFQSMNETEQYILIHHEYAGISDIEKPSGDSSNYAVSNQITAFLEDKNVKRLVVKRAADSYLKVGSLYTFSIAGSPALGKKLAVTQQSYGLTISGMAKYDDTFIPWYAIVDSSMPYGPGVFIAKGKLQVIYRVGNSTNTQTVCEYAIEIMLTHSGNDKFAASYNFPKSISSLPASGICPLVDTGRGDAGAYILIKE